MKQRLMRKIAWIMLINYSYGLLFPIRVFALTSGPSAPETQGFTPVGTSDMVDLFSGDFSYNIPLLDVGGYPVNLGYHAGIGVEQEASWVGLGWSLTPGAINRNMRGLPDDFNGDVVQKTTNIKANWTLGIGGGIGGQLFGIEQLGFNLSGGKFYNSYNGIGTEMGANFSAQIGEKVAGSLTGGLNFNSQSGLDLNGSMSLSKKISVVGLGITASAGINSRQGLKDLSFGKSVSVGPGIIGRLATAGDAKNYAFTYPTFTPTSELDYSNFSISFQGTIGLAVEGLHPNLDIRGYFSRQGLINKNNDCKAYGEMYLGNINSSMPNMMMDFNREKDIPVGTFIKTLAVPIATPDQFSVEGEGISGQYQLSRNDAGFYFDQKKTDATTGFSGGLELGPGPTLLHGGADIMVNSSNTKGGKWEEDNELNEYARFTNYDDPSDASSNPLYEPFYFKNTMEASIFPDANQLINDVNSTNVVKPGVSGGISPSGLNTVGGGSINDVIRNDERIKRNSNFTTLTIGELETGNVGLNKSQSIEVYDPNALAWETNNTSVTAIDYSELAGTTTNTTEKAKGQHIGEIQVLNDKGSTYVYGIPAYNLKSVDVSFRTDDHEEEEDGYNFYDSQLASSDNNQGKDNFYSKTVIPAYAYSYLLTGILSPDYIDVTNNGISADDLGTAIKFNYTTSININNAVTDTGNFYAWRTPTKPHSTALVNNNNVLANYQERMKALQNDQTANFSYGIKRLWFIRSIESKTMVAFFYTSNREDALGVQRNEENGELRGKYLSDPSTKDLSVEQKLDSIVLYSKAELNANSTDPVPIKVVHFIYNYSLCTGVDNQEHADSGKLTLRQVYFTYGRNTRGSLNAYVFDYKNQITKQDLSVENASYKARKADRWGNYQNSTMYNNGLQLYPDQSIYPYTIQDTVMQKEFCDVWCLKTIQLPSGGKIDIEYEPDDYAYVQNKKAGEMFLIAGFCGNLNIDSVETALSTGADQQYLFKGDYDDHNLYKYVLVDLQAGQNINQMIQDLDGELYYTCKVRVTSDDNSDSRYEFIKGYAKIASTGITSVTGHPYLGYIELAEATTHKFNEDESAPDGIYNPICLTALQTLRLSLPSLAYPGSDFSDPGDSPSATAIIGMATGLVTSIHDMISGFNDSRMNQGYCKIVDCDRASWVRLSTPDFKKIGGGNRVKSIKLHDNWNEFSDGEHDFYYGQEYDYKIYPPFGHSYSSGVALWEPALGADENLFKVPVFYDEKVRGAPDNSYYVEEPFGEMLYPSASVGYSVVKVKNLSRDNVTRTATGYTVNKFYTALDYPTKSKRTPIDLFPYKSKSSFLFLKFKSESGLTTSQGFSVEVNDMHGKQKSVENYDENGSLVSSTIYEYKVGGMVKTIGPDGVIGNKLLGCDFDSWGDSRYQETKTVSEGLSGNLETLLIVVPVPIPAPIPSYSKDTRNFHSMTFMKYIRWHGVLDRTIKMEKGSTITNSNLLYDKETAEVVVSATQNEWGDTIFSVKLPAYWAYQNMGQAYKNNRAILGNIDLDVTGITTSSTIVSALAAGDEILLLNYPGGPIRVFASRVDGGFVFLDESGGLIHDHLDLLGVVLKSGRKNLLDKYLEEKTSLRRGSIGSFKDVACDSCGFVDVSDRVVEGIEENLYQPACFDLSYESAEDHPVWGYLFSSSACYALDTVLTDVITTYNEHWPINVTDPGSSLSTGFPINPYRTGNMGNWRVDTVYQFKNERLSGTDSYTDIRKHGEFIEKVFWKNPSGDNSRIVPNYVVKPNWIPSNMITLYDENGNEVENSNSLGIYSAALFGYKHTLTTAVGSNARYQELANDNFEDYDFLTSLYSDKHFNFENAIVPTEVEISNTYSHSGLKSLKIFEPSSAQLNFSVADLTSSSGTIVNNDISTGTFTFGEKGKLPPFQPFLNSAYLVSCWVRTDENCNYNVAQSAEIDIDLNSSGLATIPMTPSGPVIEGWQKLEGTFEINPATTDITLTLKANGTDVYFDDIRIHPFNSNVKSFVYNPYNLRLMATLDENNYATFYEYDESGNLVRVKKETEKGIVTLQENRSTYREGQ